MHIHDGDLRAYQDHQLSDERRERLEAHLDSCSRCRRRSQVLSKRAERVSSSLQTLSLSDTIRPAPVSQAKSRLEIYISEKEKQTMLQKIFAQVPRWAIASVAIVVLLAAAFAIPQVRAVAVDFLGLFRVEQVAVIPINPAEISGSLETAGPRIEQMLSKDVTVEQSGETVEVETASEAAGLSGIAVRLPAALDAPGYVSVEPGMRVEYTVDLPHLRALLKELGQEELSLPDDLNNETIIAELPTSVVARFGNCEVDIEKLRREGYDPDHHGSYYPQTDCRVLVQMPSPTISTPPGLDIDQIGKAFLQLAGMTQEEAEQFSQTVDWATTLVVPLPAYATSQEVQVDGVKGIAIQEARDSRNGRMSALLWVKDGIVYTFTGQMSIDEAVGIVNSLK